VCIFQGGLPVGGDFVSKGVNLGISGNFCEEGQASYWVVGGADVIELKAYGRKVMGFIM
jgi:hypothetical protein